MTATDEIILNTRLTSERLAEARAWAMRWLRDYGNVNSDEWTATTARTFKTLVALIETRDAPQVDDTRRIAAALERIATVLENMRRDHERETRPPTDWEER